uniref:Uncharacterized protein n=1 Tax=Panagrolaimus davidi TaxID=227884 RepID=A0A914PYT7_9BILA
MGSAIRDKANFERNVMVSEEDNGESSEFHIESSDHISSEVAAELEEEWDDESETMTEAEAGKLFLENTFIKLWLQFLESQIVPSTIKIMFKESNYQYLLKIQANKNRKTFSEEESE